MPPKARARPSKPPSLPDDPNLKKYRLFASSKSGPGIKIKKAVQAERTGSHDSERITNSQFSVVISDSGGSASESDDDELKEDKREEEKGEEETEEEATKSNTPGSSRVSQLEPKFVIRGGEDDDDDEEGLAVSEASSTKRSISGNTAKCSRGRKSSKMQTNNGHLQRVAAFKPLQKKRKTLKEVGETGSKGKGSLNKGKGRESSTTGQVVEDDDEEIKQLTKKANLEMFRGLSDSSDSEEFHELPEIFGADGAVKHTNQKSNEVGEKDKGITNHGNKRKASAEDVDSALGVAIASGSRKEAIDTTSYVTRQECEGMMADLRKEMQAEIAKVKTQIRLETKRLVRSEVKDEILLAQQS